MIEELPEGEELENAYPEEIVKLKNFIDGLTKTYAMFGFKDEEEFNEAVSALAISTLFNPAITPALATAVKPMLEQIVGTNFRIVYDRDGKPTLNVVFGGNVKFIINGNIEVLHNGSITTLGTGGNVMIAPTNTMIPPPITLPMLAALGIEGFEEGDEGAAATAESTAAAASTAAAWFQRWDGMFGPRRRDIFTR
jgi:hypothetical protein